jgi:RNA polymerase sigma-70 factor (TIGR02954 family)
MKDQDFILIKEAIKGNKKAFEQLIKQHYEQIYRTAFIYVHNHEDALDIVQESAYQALVSIHTLKKPEYFLTWFTKIVIRCSGQLLTKRKNVIPLTEDILSSVKFKNYDFIKEDSLLLLDGIRKLKEHYRTTIILFYYYDYSIKTISEIMKIPEGSVKTYLSRGKNVLKKKFVEDRSHG